MSQLHQNDAVVVVYQDSNSLDQNCTHSELQDRALNAGLSLSKNGRQNNSSQSASNPLERTATPKHAIMRQGLFILGSRHQARVSELETEGFPDSRL